MLGSFRRAWDVLIGLGTALRALFPYVRRGAEAVPPFSVLVTDDRYGLESQWQRTGPVIVRVDMVCGCAVALSITPDNTSGATIEDLINAAREVELGLIARQYGRCARDGGSCDAGRLTGDPAGG